MYLKNVYISGFKSFARPVNLQFREDINAIVGPNGSGKSNISDAIRFVLGEQRTSQMRSQKMEDIIFSGTESEHPRGAAEVRLVLDRGEEPDLEIARKLYRTGESSYMINKKQVRLKDVQQLFYDTGLGRNGYSIISQGGVDEIINSSPGAIRELVEEAVGIAGYKAKRAETERHLQATRDNIDRVEDILTEVGSQVEPLRKRSEKARRYLEIVEILRNIDLVSFFYETGETLKSIESIDKSLRSCNFTILDIEKRGDQLDKEYLKTKERTEKLREEIGELEPETKALSEKKSKLERERVREETILEREKIEIENQTRELERLKTEMKSLASEKKANVRRLEDERQSEHDQYKSRGEISLLLERAQEKVADIRRERERGERERERYLEHSKEVNAKLLELKTRLEVSYSNKRSSTEARAAYERDRVEYEKQEEEQAKLKTALESETRELENVRNQIGMLDEERMKTITSRDRIHAEIGTLSERLEYLNQLRENHEGYSRAVKAVLDQYGREADVYGVVGELFRVDKEYALALQTVLGARAQNIIVSDEKTTSRIIDFLKEKRVGRATFLPLSSIRASQIEAGVLRRMRETEGFVGVASELVRCDNLLRPVYQSLLGRAVVVTDFSVASVFRRAFGRYTIVTLDGEIFYPGGAIVGGRTGRETKSVLFTGLEADEIEKRIVGLKKQERECERRVVEINSQREALEAHEGKLRRRIEELQERVAQKEQEIQRLKLQLERVKSQFSDEDEAGIKELEEEIKRLEDELEFSDSGFDQKKEESALSELAHEQERLKQIDINLSTTEQRIENLNESRTRLYYYY